MMLLDEVVAPARRRVLVLAPKGRDSAVISNVLRGQGLQVDVCADISELVRELHVVAGAAFLTEEALRDDEPLLTEWIADQPPWSDFPFVVMVSRRQGQRESDPTDVRATFGGQGNLMLLERPLNGETLITAARWALRARDRQFEAERQLQAESQLRLAEGQARMEAAHAGEALSVAVDAGELGTFHCPLPIGKVDCSTRCREHFNLPAAGDVQLQAILDSVHQDDVRRVQRAFFDGRSEADSREVELRTLAADGSVRWVRAKGRVYRDPDGIPSRFDGVTLDVTAQKILESEREGLLQAEREARQEAERAGRMKDEFIATLSHELRTPLSSILGWTHILRRGGAAADVTRAADTIERNARTQARLIEDLLDVSRIASGNIRLEIQQVAVASVFEAVRQTLRPTFEAKNVAVEIDADCDHVDVMADANRLQQIVWNLVANAIKFTPKGGHVRLRADNEEGRVALRVSDNGTGIVPEFLPHVFDRFRQAESSESRAYGGLGLGLAIVRQLVEMQSGSVEAHSAGRGHGATFVVRLPGCKGCVSMTHATDTTQQVTNAVDGDALGGLRVLVVDDELDGREMLAILLRSHGAEVATAESAETALEHLEREPADLLISDIGMPHADGYQLIRAIRGSVSKGWHDLPAIALTAFARNQDAAKARQAGFQAHLSKPFQASGLLASIREVIVRR